MSVELHLPDLPEVPISLGPLRPAAPRPPVPWSVRLRDAIAGYLPLLLMGLLALGTWWLVKNTPKAPPAPAERVLRKEPDYTMTRFSLERFDAGGRLALRIEGEQMRHYPDTDRIEIEGVRVLALAPDGRRTDASAVRAVASGDGSEVQLIGDAEVLGTDPQGLPIEVRSEFLHVFVKQDRVRTHLPVQVRHGSDEMRAAGLDYDRAAGRLDLRGPMRVVLAPKR